MQFIVERESKYYFNTDAVWSLKQFFNEQPECLSLNSIVIKPDDPSNPRLRAGVDPRIQANQLDLSLFIHDTTIDMLLSDDKTSEAKHILRHEYFHCLDACVLYEKFCEIPIQIEVNENTTESNLLKQMGFYNWGEYYANRSCFDKSHLRSKFLSIESQAKQCCFQLHALSGLIQKSNIRSERVGYFISVYSSIQPFLYDVINILADYHASNGQLFKDKIDILINFDSNRIGLFNNWIVALDHVFSQTFDKYPDAIGIDNIISIGRSIFELFENFGVRINKSFDKVLDFEATSKFPT